MASAQWRFVNQLGTRSDGRISVATRAGLARSCTVLKGAYQRRIFTGSPIGKPPLPRCGLIRPLLHFDAPLWRLGGRKNVVRYSVVRQRWTVALVADTSSSVLINMFHSREDRLHNARPERRPHHDDQHLHGRTRFFPNSSEFALFNPNENFVDFGICSFQRPSLSIGRFSGACTENASPGLTAKKTVRIAKTVVARVQALRYQGSATRSHRSISASGAFEQLRSPCRGM